MASYLDKVQVNTAITDNTKLDLGHQHITTADFMQLNVATIMELVPGSKIDVNMESFARLNPLVVPTFGRASLRNRAFFVPFRTIFRGWNDFITDAVHVASDGYTGGNYTGSLISRVPVVSMSDLCGAFLNYVGTSSTDGSGFIYQVTPTPANDNWDIVYGTNPTVYYAYTVKGRNAVKILEALGYKLDFSGSKSVYLNAMPLLALTKVFCDWYFPQQYSNRVEYDILLALCNLDVNAGPLTLTAAQVNTILSLCMYVQYDSDLFVSAWDQPNQPNVGNYSSDFKLVNIDSVGSIIGGTFGSPTTYTIDGMNGVSNRSAAAANTDVIDRFGNMDAPFITSNVKTTAGGVLAAPISQYLLNALHSLTDWMLRNRMAGSRSFDRYLARFGKALPAEKMDRCLYLGANTQDIQIGDVMSTADTSASRGEQLGSYAGKGMSYGTGNFSFSTDEFGYFIIMSSIVPATGYFQGIDPLCFRKTKWDFWQPEAENLGVEPLMAANLYIPQNTSEMLTGNPYDQIFGYVPRYATYKAPTCMDRLTGNFRIASIQGGLFMNAGNSWHLMRTFNGYNDFNQDWSNVIHDPSFINGGADFSQYKRLFYEDESQPDSPDNFTIIHNFEIAEYAPMKPLYDTYQFEDKGKKVTLETNGVKLN